MRKRGGRDTAARYPEFYLPAAGTRAPDHNADAFRRSPDSFLLPTPAANRVRIIGGVFRRRVIRFPPAPGCVRRRTASAKRFSTGSARTCRARRCLDPYAGSGALTLEAASRGAALAVAVDRDRALVDALRATSAALGASRRRGERRRRPDVHRERATRLRRDLPRSAVRRRSLAVALARVRGALGAERFHLRRGGASLSRRRPDSSNGAATRLGGCIIIFSLVPEGGVDRSASAPNLQPERQCSPSSIPVRSTRSRGVTRISSAAARSSSIT